MASGRNSLQASSAPLFSRYEGFLIDVDGVVVIGNTSVPGADESLSLIRRREASICFLTNNASRSPKDLLDYLFGLDIYHAEDSILTSGEVACQQLLDSIGAGASVWVCGSEGLRDLIAERGFKIVDPFSSDDLSCVPDGIVQGFSEETSWRDLAMICRLSRAGCTWIATNSDATFPSQFGVLPGNGAMVKVVSSALGVLPTVSGKPSSEMLARGMDILGTGKVLVVGDRLDTDIAGAVGVGCDSLLVLSGVTSALDLVNCPSIMRPTYIALDIKGLMHPHSSVSRSSSGLYSCGGWSGTVLDGWLSLGGEGDKIDGLRLLCEVVWTEEEIRNMSDCLSAFGF